MKMRHQNTKCWLCYAAILLSMQRCMKQWPEYCLSREVDLLAQVRSPGPDHVPRRYRFSKIDTLRTTEKNCVTSRRSEFTRCYNRPDDACSSHGLARVHSDVPIRGYYRVKSFTCQHVLLHRMSSQKELIIRTPPSPSSICLIGMDLTRYRPSLHAHDFTPGGNSRVVMIRKKEQRTFASAKIGQETQFETLTKETVQTFRGNKIERKITSQTRGSQQLSSEFLKSLSIINIGENETEKLKPTTNGSPLNQVIGVTEKKSSQEKIHLRKKEGLDANAFALECLVAHNEKRAIHKSPPLRLSKKLCKYSEEWAKQLAASGKLMHRPESAYGENLFLLWSSTGGSGLKGSEPVNNWYAEIADHTFDREPATLKTGHFTQVVWLDSEELGVGVARSPDMKHIYVVCNYNPPGNFIGSFADNVPPIGGFLEPKPSTNPLLVTNDETFKTEMVSLHNDYRKRHCVPSLKLSDDLCKYAQEWAEHLAKTNKVIHRKRNAEIGESLFAQWSSKIAGAKDACTQWYSEVRHFTYNQEPRVLNASNFTQMVWKDSKEIGVGRAKGRLGHVYIVANYKPAGNVMGKFIENVFRPP